MESNGDIAKFAKGKGLTKGVILAKGGEDEVMMAALTLRGLDEATASRLKEEARKRGVSVNALLRTMVEEGLGLSRRARAGAMR